MKRTTPKRLSRAQVFQAVEILGRRAKEFREEGYSLVRIGKELGGELGLEVAGDTAGRLIRDAKLDIPIVGSDMKERRDRCRLLARYVAALYEELKGEVPEGLQSLAEPTKSQLPKSPS